MIRVGILGAGTPASGELVRILAMHPDVELVCAQAKGLEGKALTSVHHGLVGETGLNFTASADYSKLDVLFVDGEANGAELEQLRLERPGLKMIFMHLPEGFDPERNGVVYGLPELNRKLLVRGATAAVVPRPFESMALVALLPFAANLLLHGDISIEVSAPADVISETDLALISDRISSVLREVQLSFNGSIGIGANTSATRRSAMMSLHFDSPLDLEQTLGLYEMYDDHNFTFATTSPVGVSEVAGTNKCVIQVVKKEGIHPSIAVAADCRLRGGAGEAVHIMNLIFGLHEKTGLRLKAIDFLPVQH